MQRFHTAATIERDDIGLEFVADTQSPWLSTVVLPRRSSPPSSGARRRRPCQRVDFSGTGRGDSRRGGPHRRSWCSITARRSRPWFGVVGIIRRRWSRGWPRRRALVHPQWTRSAMAGSGRGRPSTRHRDRRGRHADACSESGSRAHRDRLDGSPMILWIGRLTTNRIR